MNEVIPYVHYSWVVQCAVYIMIQCTEHATPAVIACCELPVLLQEAVLGLKTPSPITVLSERGEGFFRQLEKSRSKKKDRRKQYSGRRRQMQADSDALTGQ